MRTSPKVLRGFLFTTLVLLSSVGLAATVTSITMSPPAYTTTGLVTSPTFYLGMTAAGPVLCGNTPQGTNCDTCAATTGFLLSNAVYANNGPLCSVADLTPNTIITITMVVTPSTTTCSTTGSTTTTGTCAGTEYFPIAYLNSSTSTGLTLSSQVPFYPVAGQSNTLTYQFLLSTLCTAAGASGCTSSFAPTTINLGWSTTANSVTPAETAIPIVISFRYAGSQTAGAVTTASPATSPWASWGTAAAYTGFYNFTLFPGDGKAYVTGLEAASTASYAVMDLTGGANNLNGADVSGNVYSKIRMYYVQTTPASLTNPVTVAAFSVSSGQASGTDYYEDLTFDSANSSVSPEYVSGLQNSPLSSNTEYQMILAPIDQAGIISYFTNPSQTAASPLNFAVSPLGTTQAVQPQPVFGLLNGQGCFIATAAYGSIFAKQVEYFRAFRGRYLMDNKWGKAFVHWYYANSPRYAVMIEQHQDLRWLARLALFPLLLFVRLALWIGLLPAVLVATGLLAFASFAVWKWRRHRRMRA